MTNFRELPEFSREFKRLNKKYPSLVEDLGRLQILLEQYPLGTGNNFSILQKANEVTIIKSRLSCRSLRNHAIRVIYAYHETSLTFLYIEIYFKGDKANEDRARIVEYLKTL
ncbi:TPA: hypothetical protein DEP96_03075 [Candidatus Uhrbacteria bacterium]|nr:hypothetical protein [Candidatus Uhrbacteria bacterium]